MGPDDGSVASLYNEALSLAEEGLYGQAKARLHHLLSVAPHDGEAHLLLAKVHAGGRQWRSALAELDEATRCGTVLPADLRAEVVRLLQAQEPGPEETHAASDTDAPGEFASLRGEARRLRSENAHLLTTVHQLQRETARWAWVAVATSATAILLLTSRMLFGGATVEAPAATHAMPEVVEAAARPVRNADVAALAEAALENAASLEGAELAVVVRDGRAELSGKARTYAQVREAVRLLGDLDGIEHVGHGSIKVLARTKGAHHVVVSGDTLSKIAWDYYGDETPHDVILASNAALEGKASRLRIGMELVVPPLPTE